MSNVNFAKLPNKVNSTEENTNVGFYNFIGRSIFGGLKRLRKLDRGGYYIDLVSGAGLKSNPEKNQAASKMTYSSLRIVNAEDVKALLQLDEALNGALSKPHPDSNEMVRAVLDIGDLNVRAFSSNKSEVIGSVAVGSLLKIKHLQHGKDVYTEIDGAATTYGYFVKEVTESLGQFNDLLSVNEFENNQVHVFTGVGFVNRVFNNEDEGTIRLSAQFIHGDKAKPNRSRVYIDLDKNHDSEMVEHFTNAFSNGNSPKCFIRATINITGNSGWKFETKDNGEKLMAALYANAMRISYISIDGEVVHSASIETVNEQSDSDKLDQALQRNGVA